MQAQTAKAAYEAARKRESESTLLAEQQRSRAGRAEAVSSKLQATLDEKMQAPNISTHSPNVYIC